MAAWPPVVLRMNVDDYKVAKKIRKAIENMHGVRRVSASPEQGLVFVYGTADAWAIRRRIWRKMKRRASVVNDGSAPYSYYQGPTPAPHYDWGVAPPSHYSYYSHPPPPQHAAYSHPPPPPPGYAYAHGGYDGWAADYAGYDGYAAHSTVPTCSIL